MKSYKTCMLNKKRGVTQKSEVYYDAYTHMFSLLNSDEKLTILEIGVRGGGGLYTLKEYFPNSTIIGLDIDSSCMQWEQADNNIFVRIGDQADTKSLQNIVDEFGTFDLIIDDGSHICSHQIKSFEFLFDKLNLGGLYVIEDLHTSYWKNFHDRSISAIDYFKELSIMPTKRWACNTNRSVFNSIEELNEIEFYVDSVYFYDSICFVRKVKSEVDLQGLIKDYKQYFVTQ